MKPKVILRAGANQNFTLTISGSEANMQRLVNLLLFAERPGDVKVVNELGPLPWEDEASPQFVPPPLSLEALQEAATKAITTICNTWVHGLDDVKKTLASFHVARMRDLTPEQLPRFIEALNFLPDGSKMASEPNPDDLV